MIVVEVLKYQDGDSAAEVIARLTIPNNNGLPKVEGRAHEIINFSEAVISINRGVPISFDEDPEEWARSLPNKWRGPSLWAAVVHDDNLNPSGDY